MFGSVEQFFINYAGGFVDETPYKEIETTLPRFEQDPLQMDIIKYYKPVNPVVHSGWANTQSLGPVFSYRTEKRTASELYPALNININGDIYTIGAERPTKEDSLHYCVLGNSGFQIDFINQQPWSKATDEQKQALNKFITEAIKVNNNTGGDPDNVKGIMQIIYSKTSFIDGTYPKVIDQETPKPFAITNGLA